jgi:prepilin-type N-terminal cleavage/methylation domain-containing protein
MMKRAFTMIELLIVISIIGVLAAMLILVSKNARDRVNSSITHQRIEAVIQGLLAYQSDGSLALALQSGPLSVSISNGFALSNDNWTSVAATIPGNTRYFWDKPFGKGAKDYVTGAPDVDRLSNFNPQKTIELLRASGVMMDHRTEQRTGNDPTLPPGPYSVASKLLATDRSGKMAWNDAWGNPIIVGYAIYQTKGDATQRKIDIRNYGFNRAVYLSAGAVGKVKRSSINYSANWTGDSGVLQKSWNMINEIVNTRNRDGNDNGIEITEELYVGEQKPWSGIATATGKGLNRKFECYLSAPQEVK